MCAYCTVQDMKNILPENIKIGDNNIGTPVPGRSGSGSTRSNITPDQAQYYIGYASQYIDGRLRPYYVCPLRRVKSYETAVENNLIAGTDVSITVEDSGSFISHEVARIQDKDNMEVVTISSVPNLNTVIVSSLLNNYDAENRLMISVLEFPDPVPLMTAQLAVSIMLDRLFVAEQSPDVSQYGKSQRNYARDSMDSILKGQVLLFGQEHTGRRFVRGSVFDAYMSPAEVTKGEEKE